MTIPLVPVNEPPSPQCHQGNLQPSPTHVPWVVTLSLTLVIWASNSCFTLEAGAASHGRHTGQTSKVLPALSLTTSSTRACGEGHSLSRELEAQGGVDSLTDAWSRRNQSVSGSLPLHSFTSPSFLLLQEAAESEFQSGHRVPAPATKPHPETQPRWPPPSFAQILGPCPATCSRPCL